jgi:hypothetical protein
MLRLIERSATIAMTGPRLRLAVVSDTHSHPHPRTIEHLTRMAPDAILHGGDIGDLGVLEPLAELAPLYAVRGNIDAGASRRAGAIEVADVQLLEVARPGAPLRIYLTHIAIYGVKLRAEVGKRARAAGSHLVVCGHSHVPFLGTDRGVTLFNPGSIGPRRFGLPICFGTIDVTADQVALAHWSCETGERWSPP